MFVILLAVCLGAASAFDPMTIYQNHQQDEFKTLLPNPDTVDKTVDRFAGDIKNWYRTSSDFLKATLGEYSSLETDAPNLKTDAPNLKTDAPSLRTDAPSLRTDDSSLKTDVVSAADVDELLALLDSPDLRDQTDKAKQLFRRVNLRQILLNKQMNGLTLFVPTNNAIRKWKKKNPQLDFDNVDFLTTLFKAFVVPNDVRRTSLMRNDDKLRTLLTDVRPEVKLRVNTYGFGRVTVNGAIVGKKNIGDRPDAKCILHIITDMIFPLPDGSIMKEVKESGRFTKLVELLESAEQRNLKSSLDGDADALTVFAPTDEAFKLIPDSKMKELKTNSTKLANLLKYHVIPKTYFSAGIGIGRTYKSLKGDKIKIGSQEKDQFVLNPDYYTDVTLAPRVIRSDIPATNGVIHIIDKVLEIPVKPKTTNF